MVAAFHTRITSSLDTVDRGLMPCFFVIETNWVAITVADISHMEIALRANRIVRRLVAVRDALGGRDVLEAHPRSGVADVHHSTLGERNRGERDQRGERAEDGHPTKEATRSNKM